ncbi:hypothetical protein DICPUDRAFT_98877 [Dictyostelium purpureum]|uniref:Minichromosome loss protein Mcl1 middle region domain-containing protein n=1 Tax=Dictyostelium purpureum TaxID=5786 RepID=F0ZUC6_DICPU|nr:uncharacterized protein DICPUDRAFT_98877 [Dictyostelium purpureum]EGC32444.1 hypothetical protein DICPUDRAFT_98877 [Dictyostelium purpureum]|eukprot:XP_003291016.1 hypothetical protein DICPUDRAFT_98877 [Dictyostelium purpureum]
MAIKKKNSLPYKDRPINNVDSESKNNNSIGLLKYHPDRNKILYCYPNSKSVFYGDAADGTDFELIELGSHNKAISSIDIGAKNKCATASFEDNKVIIFSCISKNDRTEIKTSSNPTYIQFNPTQSYIAIGLSSGQIKYHSVNVSQSITINNAHNGDIVCLSFTSDGDYLASIGDDNKLKIWSTESFEHDNPTPIHTIDIESSPESLKKIGISWRQSDQRELTIPTLSGSIISYIFDETEMSNDYKTRSFGSEGHTKEATSVAWDNEGKYLASIGLDSNLFIWNGDFDESNPEEPVHSYKHKSPINSFSWRSQPSSNCISFFDKENLKTYTELLHSENLTSSQEKIIEDDIDDFEIDIDENEVFNNNQNNNNNENQKSKSVSNEDSDKEMNENEDNNSNLDEDENNGNEDNASVYSQQVYENCQQESFQIGSTLLNVLNNPKTLNLKTKRYYMAYSMLGKIVKREESPSSNEPSSIEIEFHETGYNKKITFSDINHNLRLSSLGPNGAVFATKYLQNEKEEYEQQQQELIEKQKNSDEKDIGSQIKPLESVIMFKPFDTLGDTTGTEWSLTDTEEVSGVSISKNFIVSVSSNRTLRLFSLGGIQMNLFTLPGDLVTMNTFDDTLAIVYHRSNALNDNQSMNVWWINLANGKQIYHDSLSISPSSSLSWIGFSDNGLLTTMDSIGVVRQLSNGWYNNQSSTSFLQWTLIMDLRKCQKPHSLDLYTYWIIGLNTTDLYSIFCTGYPQTPKCTHNYVKIEAPLLSSVDSPILSNEREFLKNKYNLSNLVNQTQNNLNSSCINSMGPLEDSVLTKHLTDLDTATLRLFNYYTKLGKYQKAIDLCKNLNMKKSLQIAFTYSNGLRLPWLTKKIVELIENFKPINVNNTPTTTISPKTTTSSQNQTVVVDSPPKKAPKQQSDSEPEEEEEEEEKPIEQSPKSTKTFKNTTKSVKKNPFLIKKSSDTSDKKRKETQSNNQPSKISKFQ